MKKGISIYQKIILFQFAAILVTSIIFGIYLYIDNINKETRNLTNQTEQIKEKIAYKLSGLLWNFDVAGYNKVLAQEIKNKYLIALVIKQENKILSGIIKSDKGEVSIIEDIMKVESRLKKAYQTKREKITYINNGVIIELAEVILYITDNPIKESIFGFLLQTIIQTLFLIIILSCITFIILKIFFNKPLSAFKDIFSNGASGNLSIKYPEEGNARDEIYELGTMFNTFIHKVRGVINEVIDVSNELSTASEELSVTINHFSDNSQNQAASTQEITATIEEISSGVENISGNANFQYENLNDVIKKISELSDLIKSMAEKITSAQKFSKEISEQAIAGNDSLNLMNKSMNEITESSNSMINIVSIIDDISNQINLLSLNAAIEAARAGEAGRGFAVVADEISKLADQTASSIGEIDTLIKKNNIEIENGMKNVVNAISGIEKITNGLNSIDDMTNDIYHEMRKQLTTNESVNNRIDELRIRSDEIKNATHEQKNAVTEVMKTITSINDITQSNASGAEQITANSNRLADMAVNLKTKISFFKI